ncbi:hypothetical protein F9C11_08750 [Amycolatopsis sp. VS8301801F10]|uniref:hypothetical protein n=1 Tax=Amycolatopsis sp. VS8301801F10 TaxID=2652442 RepID=UPI0038FC460A
MGSAVGTVGQPSEISADEPSGAASLRTMTLYRTTGTSTGSAVASASQLQEISADGPSGAASLRKKTLYRMAGSAVATVSQP